MRLGLFPVRATSVIALLASILGSALLFAQQQPPANKSLKQAAGFPQPVIDTHELMELFSEPIYLTLRRTLNSAPDGEQQWNIVVQEAKRAAEVANLIAIREKSAKFANWQDHAQHVQRAARALVQRAEEKNYEASRDVYIRLIQHCNDCHRETEPAHAPNLAPFGNGSTDDRKGE